MGDVKPPSSGTGDSGVLLLIHDYGSNFSNAVERISRRQKMFNAAKVQKRRWMT